MITSYYLLSKYTNSLTKTSTKWPAYLYQTTTYVRHHENFRLLQRPFKGDKQALGYCPKKIE